MMSYKNELIVLVEIEAALAALTEKDRERAERTLSALEDKDKSVGVVHDLSARDLYVLAHKFNGQYATLMTDSLFKAESEEEQKALQQEAARSKTLGELCKDLFWIHARQEMGRWSDRVGIRAGWVFVDPAPETNSLKRLLGLSDEGE